jgi:predicted RND superfamily exporter protein
VVQDHEYIVRHWGDYFPLEFTITPTGGKTVTEPALTGAIRSFITEAEALPEVRTGTGLSTFFDYVFPVLYGPFAESAISSRTELDRVTRSALRRDPELMRSFVTAELRTTRITFTGRMMSAGELDRVITKVNALAAKHFRGLAVAMPTGYPPLYSRIVAYIMQSQQGSFPMAVGLIFLLLLLMLRDFKLALIAVLPNFFPVLLLLGVMGYLGITLDIATATVAAIVIGFSVDDTIHYLYNYRAERKRDPLRAQQRTMRHVGSAIVLTSVVIFTGFLVLLLASVKTVFYFGLLTAVSIAGELTAQLVLLPLLLHQFDRPVPQSKTLE